jgi:hypothetical protein
MSPDTRWKQQERSVAALLGGIRLPNNGRGQPDVRAPGLAVQVKTMKQLPLWLTEAVAQSTREADPDELPIVVLCAVSRGRKARRLLVVDLDTLTGWQPERSATKGEGV